MLHLFRSVARFRLLARWLAAAAVAGWIADGRSAVAADTPPAAGVSPRHWKPVPDAVYLQEVGQQIPTDSPTTAVAVHRDTVFAVVGGTLKTLQDRTLHDAPGAPMGIKRLRALDGALWAAAGDGTYRLTNGGWTRVHTQPFRDFCWHLGQVVGASVDELFRFENDRFLSLKPADGYLSNDTTVMMSDGNQVLADPVEIGPILRIASYSGTLYLLRPDGLALIEGPKLVPNPVDWGTWPSRTLRDLLALGSRLCVATDRGVAVLRGMALTSLRGPDGLPYEDTTCLAAGFEGDLWIGTSRGAIREVDGEYHFFGAQHWLPGDYVHDLAVGDRAVYIATDRGLGVIHYEPTTLAAKAAYFERALEEGGFKRLGFVHKLYWAGEKDGWWREISDNDGGHTAHYLAAMCFKYATTGEEQARQEALDAFKAMIWLDDITPSPGFIARSIWSVQGDQGLRSRHGSGGLPAKWYPTADGLWIWKGDTSSDEVNAHFYAVSVFHDLVARGAEKERAARHLGNIAAHIIDHGWVLRDLDGKPTRWGRWDPDYLLRPYGFEARGLNGMEAQTYMHTALALTGDAKFQAGLDQLLEWRYHTYTVRQKLTFPPESVVPWDDELAFRCFHPLLRYTRDPELRSIYLRSLERHWEVMRMQQVAFFNFVYGALTGNDCEAPEAVRHLREWSLELVNHSYHNSHRSDLAPRPGYVPYGGGTRGLSPRETTADWESRSALVYDGGDGGRGITPPIGWLEDYWLGRYYGFIEAPKTNVSPAFPPAVNRARPYLGPTRPVAAWEPEAAGQP